MLINKWMSEKVDAGSDTDVISDEINLNRTVFNLFPFSVTSCSVIRSQINEFVYSERHNKYLTRF